MPSLMTKPIIHSIIDDSQIPIFQQLKTSKQPLVCFFGSNSHMVLPVLNHSFKRIQTIDLTFTDDYDRFNQGWVPNAGVLLIKNAHIDKNILYWATQWLVSNYNDSNQPSKSRLILMSRCHVQWFNNPQKTIQAIPENQRLFFECVPKDDGVIQSHAVVDQMGEVVGSSNRQRVAFNRFNQWLRHDCLDAMGFIDCRAMNRLVQYLTLRIGQRVCIATVADYLNKDPKTIKAWLDLLEQMYVLFRVPPYSNGIPRAIKKESKFYFFDCDFITNHRAWLENTIAKKIQLTVISNEWSLKHNRRLYFVNDKQGHCIDFLVLNNDSVEKSGQLIKLSWDSGEESRCLLYYSKFFKSYKKTQLIQRLNMSVMYKKSGIQVTSLDRFQHSV